MTNHGALLPCPFCGSEAMAYDDGEDCIATCNNGKCDALPACVGNKTVEEAVRKWNARTPSSADAATKPADSFIDIVCDAAPGPDGCTFIEVENCNGQSIRYGDWVERGDGYWALRLPVRGDSLVPSSIAAISDETAESIAQGVGRPATLAEALAILKGVHKLSPAERRDIDEAIACIVAFDGITDEMIETALAAARECLDQRQAGWVIDTREHWTDGDRAAMKAALEAVIESAKPPRSLASATTAQLHTGTPKGAAAPSLEEFGELLQWAESAYMKLPNKQRFNRSVLERAREVIRRADRTVDQK